MAECLGLLGILLLLLDGILLLPLFELVSRQDFSFAVVTYLDQLPSQLSVL